MDRSRLHNRRPQLSRSSQIEQFEGRLTLNGVPLTADIVDVSPDPRNSPVDQVQIVFSEPVSGFERADLILDRSFDGKGSLLTDAQTLTSVDGRTWTLGNLAPLTGVPSIYAISLRPGHSVVSAVGGTPLANSPTEVWQNNGGDVVRPTMNIVDIAPDPYEGPVTSLQIVFSEPVGGFELGDLRLSRQNAPGVNLLGAAQTLTTLDRQTWTLGNLTDITQIRDRYTLNLNSNHLVFDLAGNPLAAEDTESWVGGDSQKPYATIGPVVPDPRTGGVDSVKIVFTEPVTGFDLTDLVLDRAFDGKGSPFTGQETLTTTDHIEWTLGNLTAATSAGGHYYLSLSNVGSAIVDLSGNSLAAGVFEDWLNAIGDTTPPTVAIEAVAPDPRVTSVANVKIVFSEAVSGIKLSQFTLTRRFEGKSYDLTGGLTLSTADQATWSLGGLAGTSATGTYELRFNTGVNQIRDLAGNVLNAPNQELTESWVNTADVRPTATIVPVSPDPRITPVDSIDVVFSRPVTGLSWQNFNLQRSDDGLSNLITSAQTVSTVDGITWTLGNLSGLTAQDAYYEMSVGGTNVFDADGNTLKGGAVDTWTNRIAEVSPLTVAIIDVVPDSRTSPVTSIDFVFSAPVTGFDLSDLVLVRGNNSTTNVLTQLQTLTTADQIHFTLSNLDPVNTEYNSYRLTIRAGGNGIADQFGNPLNNPRSNPISESWTIRFPRVVDIVDVTPDPRSTPVDTITIILEAPRVLTLGSFYLECLNDGLPNLITSAQTLSTTDNIAWVLGNLAPITTRGGVYQLRIDDLLEQWTNTSPVPTAQSRVAAADLAWEGWLDSASPDLWR